MINLLFSPDIHKFGSNSFPIGFKFISNSIQIRFKFVSISLQIRFKFVSILFKIRFRISSLFESFFVNSLQFSSENFLHFSSVSNSRPMVINSLKNEAKFGDNPLFDDQLFTYLNKKNAN